MSEIISSDLFDSVLINPLRAGADKLCIVSGYATANMVLRHVDFASSKPLNKKFSIDLIVGMAVHDGMEKANHQGFIEIQSNKYNVDFNCSYVVGRPPVHSKLYIWLKDGKPMIAFAGSANYSQNAFSPSMREILMKVNERDAFDYFNQIKGETQNCASDNIGDFIRFYARRIVTEVESVENESEPIENLESITLTLLDSGTNETPTRSGINWGQRADQGREPNQAYINIPAEIGRSGFFPERGVVFTIITDDGKHLICVRAQDGGKGLHTTLNNSHMGEYLRFRIGVANGAYVTKADLLRYGRTDVTVYKIDEETYYMDFSV